MYTTALIRRFLLHHPLNQLFTTRDVLCYGNRSSVDNCLYELVRGGVLIRVVRGIFVKAGSTRVFTNLELARIKAESFGRKLMPHPTTYNCDRPSPGLDDPNETVFAISGYSSSFMYGKIRIFLRALISRKAELLKTRVGAGINHIWAKENWESICDSKLVWKVRSQWGQDKKIEFASLCGLMPWWILDHFEDWFGAVVALQFRKKLPLEPE